MWCVSMVQGRFVRCGVCLWCRGGLCDVVCVYGAGEVCEMWCVSMVQGG